MEIGTAIREIRKSKSITQKELAVKCNLSNNSITQIELNNTFPKKDTIKKICKALKIPTAFLLFYSLTEKDIPKNKREIYRILTPLIKKLIVEI